METCYTVETKGGQLVAKLYAVTAADAVSKVKDLYPWLKSSRLFAVETKEQRGRG